MEPAVTTVLAGVLSQVTAWDDLGDLRVCARLPSEPEASSLAAGGPHSRRNCWQPQATGLQERLILREWRGGQSHL